LDKDDYVWDNKQPTLTAESEKQLHIDAINVNNGAVKIATFDEDYQNKVISYIRFFGYRYDTTEGFSAPQTNDTLDVV
tara:strand:+ start:5521 stop:5754 length:234 start_codon:yes stop_codon:yes gene_type:complete